MTSSRQLVATPDAPAAIGPYSQAVRSGDLLFCSGQIPLDPDSGELVGQGDPGAQTKRCLESLQAVCAAAGTTLDQALKVTIYLQDMSVFEQVNAAYAGFFGAEPPARATVAVSGLALDVDVEIEAIVGIPGDGGPAET